MLSFSTSTISTVDALREAIAACELIASEAQLMLADLRERKNRIARVHHLPPELLIDIWTRNLTPGSRYYTDLRQIRLVSARWKDVANEAAGLWTTACCSDKPAELEMAVKRSCGLPMDVVFPCREAVGSKGRTHSHTRVFEILGIPSSRVVPWRSLDMKPFIMDWNTFQPTFLKPAPHLERISLTISKGARELIQVEGDLFAGDAPRLQHVQLSGCSVEWSSPVLSQLKSLSLSYIPLLLISTQTLLRIIAESPQLETLYLATRFVLGELTDAPPESGDNRVICRSLRSLTLNKINVTVSIWLLNQIDAPSLSSFHLEEHAAILSRHDLLIGALEKWLVSHVQRYHEPTLRLKINGYEVEMEYGRFDVTLNADEDVISMAPLAAKLLSKLPSSTLARITCLNLDVSDFPENCFHAIHPYVYTITELSLQSTYNTNAITILSRSHNSIPGDTVIQIPPVWWMPRMTTFRTGWRTQGPIPNVLAVVQNRATREPLEGEVQAPYPDRLQRLVIERGKIPQTMLDTIRELGVTVDLFPRVTVT